MVASDVEHPHVLREHPQSVTVAHWHPQGMIAVASVDENVADLQTRVDPKSDQNSLDSLPSHEWYKNNRFGNHGWVRGETTERTVQSHLDQRLPLAIE